MNVNQNDRNKDVSRQYLQHKIHQFHTKCLVNITKREVNRQVRNEGMEVAVLVLVHMDHTQSVTEISDASVQDLNEDDSDLNWQIWEVFTSINLGKPTHTSKTQFMTGILGEHCYWWQFEWRDLLEKTIDPMITDISENDDNWFDLCFSTTVSPHIKHFRFKSF